MDENEEEDDLTSAGKFIEPRFRFAAKFHRLAAPEKAHGAGVKRLVRQNEPGKLLRRQAIFDQRQIQILVAAVKFVADDGMAEVGEVDADLMFAAGAGNEAKQRKRGWRPPLLCFGATRMADGGWRNRNWQGRAVHPPQWLCYGGWAARPGGAAAPPYQ